MKRRIGMKKMRKLVTETVSEKDVVKVDCHEGREVASETYQVI